MRKPAARSPQKARNTAPFFSRELSWLEFNYRVLEEACDLSTPLFERLKFLSIYSNNLDEFIMVRVAALASQVKSGYARKHSSGLSAEEILSRISERLDRDMKTLSACFMNDIRPGLKTEGYQFLTASEISGQDRTRLETLFNEKYRYILTPLAVDSSHPFPFLASKRLNLLVTLSRSKTKPRPFFALVPVPSDTRLIPLDNDGLRFIFMEEFIRLFVHKLFEGHQVLRQSVFRVTRDAELLIDEEDTQDLLSAIRDELKKRDRGIPVRLEIEAAADAKSIRFLEENIGNHPGFRFMIDGPLDLAGFFEFDSSNAPAALKDVVLEPCIPGWFDGDQDIFSEIAKHDRLLHLPYQSFAPVHKFLDQAADDPKVLAIKQTLYRTSAQSPILTALKRAIGNGKQVTVLIELKARFDEALNIRWARQLEDAGAHVIYGVQGLKTHCKLTLVVREEESGIKRYLHLSTGNYNDKTAKVYTDIGYFTCRDELCDDATSLFNMLTGNAEPSSWNKFVASPLRMREFIIDRIRNEVKNRQNGADARITAKMNSLTDPAVIRELYIASRHGVKISLIVRGMCTLIPGRPELSDNIRVTSIVDRFLEHSRIFYFYNTGDEEFYVASADWMERNFDRRVEICFPIENGDLRKDLVRILDAALADNVKARILQPDGSYVRRQRAESEQPVRSQILLHHVFNNPGRGLSPANDPVVFTPLSRPAGDSSN